MAYQIYLLIAIVTLIIVYLNIETRPVTSLVIVAIAWFIGTGAILPAIATIILLIAFHINMMMFRTVQAAFKAGFAQLA